MSQNRKHKFLKILVVTVGVLILGALGVARWAAQHYEKIIKEQLPGISMRSTNGLYHITFNDLSINIFTLTVTVHDIKIWHDRERMKQMRGDSTAPKYYVGIEIPKMEVHHIAWDKLLGNQEMNCGQLKFIRPQVSMTYLPEMPEPKKDSTKKQPGIERIFAGEVAVKNGKFTYITHKAGKNSTVYLEGANISLTDWEFTPKATKDTSKFLYAKNAIINFKSFRQQKEDGLYTIRGKAIYFEPLRDSLQILGLQIVPRLNRDEFYRQRGKQGDYYDFSFPFISCSKIDWKTLMKDGRMNIELVRMKNVVMSDYFSRIPPPNMESKFGKFPHQLLMKLELPLNIRRINLYNATGSYTELSRVTKHTGTLLFTNVNGSITNVTNMQDAIQKDSHCMISLRGKFMRQSDIAANFDLLLTSKSGAFSVSSYLKSLDAEQINTTAQALALAEIKSAHISRLDMNITGNENESHGHFAMQYNNLKINLQKMNSDSSGLRRRGFLSFIANNIFLFPANPMPDDSLRTVDTRIERDKYKSFFNLIWANIFDGAIKTVARNEDVVEILQKKKNPGAQAKSQQDNESQGLFETILNKKDKKNKEKRGNR